MLWGELGKCSRICLPSFSISGQPLEKPTVIPELSGVCAWNSRAVSEHSSVKFPAPCIHIYIYSIYIIYMYMHMQVCIYIYVYVCVRIHVYIYICICVYSYVTYTHACKYAWVDGWVTGSLDVWMYGYTYVCMHVRICVPVYPIIQTSR